MTFEEIQKTIEGMLAVQKELQETQINFRSDLQAFREEQANFQTNFQAGLQALREEQAIFQANFQAGLQTLREEQVELSRREGILIEEVNRLIVLSNKNEVNINRLIGYRLSELDIDSLNLSY